MERTGLWYQTSKTGLKYAKGKIEIDGKKYRVVLFKNNKQNEKQPDYNIIISK